MARKKRDSMVVVSQTGDRAVGYRVPTLSDEDKKLLSERFAGAELDQLSGTPSDEDEDDGDFVTAASFGTRASGAPSKE